MSLRPRSPASLAPIDGTSSSQVRSPIPLSSSAPITSLRPRSPVPEETGAPRSRSPATIEPLHVFSALRPRSPVVETSSSSECKKSDKVGHLPPLPQVSHEKKSYESHTSIDSFRKNQQSFSDDEDGGSNSGNVLSTVPNPNDLSSALLLTSLRSQPDCQHLQTVNDIRRARRSFTEEDSSRLQNGHGNRNLDPSSTSSTPEKASHDRGLAALPSPDQRRPGLGQLPHLEGPSPCSSLRGDGGSSAVQATAAGSHRHGPQLEHLEVATSQARKSEHKHAEGGDKHHLHDNVSESKSRSRTNSFTGASGSNSSGDDCQQEK